MSWFSKIVSAIAISVSALTMISCGGGVAQGSWEKESQNPTISWFTASPIGAGLSENTILKGQSAVLQYSFRNGQGSISPTVGAVTSEVSSTVSPISTTTYTLTVANASSTATKKAADELTDDDKISKLLNRILTEPAKKSKLVDHMQREITQKYIKMTDDEIKNELYWIHTDNGALDTKKIIDDLFKIVD